MQPDPLVFLRGIRKEVLLSSQASINVDDAVQATIMLRSGELLSNIIMRYEALPTLLPKFHQQQLTLLGKMIEQLKKFNIKVPDVTDNLLLKVNTSVSEQTIANYDNLLNAQSQCLLALEAKHDQPAIAKTTQQLLEKVCRLQQAFFLARDDALRKIENADIDQILVEKLTPTDELLSNFLRLHFPEYPDIGATIIRQLKGVNTKEVYFINLEGHPDWPKQAVMRRNREFDPAGNEVADEFNMLQYLHRCKLPVPKALFSGSQLGNQYRSFLVLEHLPGKPHTISELGNSARQVMQDLAKNLAQLHCLDASPLGDEYQIYGEQGRVRTLNMLNRFHTMIRQNQTEPSVAVEAAFLWLRSHVDKVDDVTCIVHGDYNLRNNLVDQGRVTGILDWELAHEGHPAEDLGYVRPQVEEIMPWSEFMKVYIEYGGKNISDELVRYFQIYGMAFGIAPIFPACHGYITGKHSDLLIGAAGTIERSVLERVLMQLILTEYEVHHASY